MRAGDILAGAALIALWVAVAPGCWKAYTTGAPGLAQAQPDALTIAPVPFGEMNGREEYNASDIIPIAE